MNVREFLGLDSAYSHVLMHNSYADYNNFDGPYTVDKILRETPIIPDYSFRQGESTYTFTICEYFNPLIKGSPLNLLLSKNEYDEYMYIRSNAFYTPYGVMVLLNQPSISCTNWFYLTDDSLIPKNRKIMCVDKKMYPPNDKSRITATFFADYVMENMILSFSTGVLHESMYLYDTKDVCAVLMKRVQLNPNIPVYDVQFSDLMAFDNRMSYNMYMLAVSNYLCGVPSSADKLSFRFNKDKRLFKCYVKDNMYT